MQKWMLVLAVGVFSASSFAATTSRGYVTENNRLKFFLGLTWGGGDDQITLSQFSNSQVSTMMSCMGKKNTHAIEVTSHETEIKGVPIPDFPGKTTTVHGLSIDKVSCVKAPGYLQQWRAAVQKMFNN